MSEISSKSYLIKIVGGGNIIPAIIECIQLSFDENIDCEFEFNGRIVKINRDEIIKFVHDKYLFKPVAE